MWEADWLILYRFLLLGPLSCACHAINILSSVHEMRNVGYLTLLNFIVIILNHPYLLQKMLITHVFNYLSFFSCVGNNWCRGQERTERRWCECHVLDYFL